MGHVRIYRTGEETMKQVMARPLRRVHTIATLIIVLTLALYWIHIHWGEPASYYSLKYDPEYPYFMNSLSVFKGRSYSYMDHPGTPVELLGTGLLILTYPFIRGSSDSFAMYHISNPETFLTMGRAFIALMSFLCVYLLARYSTKLKTWIDGFFSLAIAATFFVVLSPLTFKTLTYWSHNSFNFPFGSLLLLGLLVRLRSDLNIRWWEISLFGIGAGILTAIQLYFATWVIGICIAVGVFSLLKYRGWRKAILSSVIGAASSLFGFVFATLPVIHKYMWFRSWVRDLLTHQGRYGLGEIGFTSASRMLENFISLWEEAPIVFLSAGFSLLLVGAALLLHRRKMKVNPGLWAVAIGLSSQLIVTLLIILKHPGIIYLLAVAATLPVLFSVVYALLSESKRYFKQGFIVLGTLILIGFFLGLFQAIAENRDMISNIHLMEADLREHRIHYAETKDINLDEQTILWSYGTGSPCSALYFGNVYASNAFTEEIQQVCPQEGRYDIWSDGDKLSAEGKWDIIVIPEKFLPDDAEEYGSVEVSGAITNYGRIFFIIAGNEG
jgi:hypothetical protein